MVVTSSELKISLFAVAIDGEDVTKLAVTEITSLMQTKFSYQRKLTIVTSVQKTYSVFDAASKPN